MQRFYISYFVKQDIFILEDKDIFHQLTKVLRIRLWEEIIIFNWKNNLDYTYRISEINKKNIKLNFIEELKKESELDTNLNLYQAFPNKFEKIEYIIQKWVEVWIKKFIFYRSERSQKIVISDKKEERLKKIIIEAVEQSSRNFVPELNIILGNISLNFLQWKTIFLHTKDQNSHNLKNYIQRNLNKKIENINMFIWPEWWFSDSEIKIFEEQEFTRIHLWNRILRTETAWIVVWFTLWQLL